MQLYVPPVLMVNKDFIRQILSDEKELMEVDAIRKVNMPRYDELSVKNFWPRIQGNMRVMRFFPDKLPKGRQPDHQGRSSQHVPRGDSLNALTILHLQSYGYPAPDLHDDE